jgi:hypothetical protein
MFLLSLQTAFEATDAVITLLLSLVSSVLIVISRRRPFSENQVRHFICRFAVA